MPNLSSARNPESIPTPNWLTALFFMLIVLVANGAVMLGLLLMLNRTEFAFLVLSGIALSGGTLFTLATLRKLGNGQ